MIGPAESPTTEPPTGERSRRRLWGVVTGVVVVGFVALVVTSIRPAAVPVGVSGGMIGMPMAGSGSSDAMQMSMRDVDGRVVQIPAGRPGVALFVDARNSATWVDALRRTARAVRAAAGEADLLVVSVDSATTRDDVDRLARSAGRPEARYFVDDRNGSVTSMFRGSALGSAVVYDARGRARAHPATAAQVGEGLAQAMK